MRITTLKKTWIKAWLQWRYFITPASVIAFTVTSFITGTAMSVFVLHRPLLGYLITLSVPTAIVLVVLAINLVIKYKARKECEKFKGHEEEVLRLVFEELC